MIREHKEERYNAVLHKRYGWIVAPEGYWIRESASGKSYELCSDEEPRGLLFPLGTRWNATSILAMSG